jgi:rRNA processing protein Gar1
LYYLGKSKKHQIFRTRTWNKTLEKITNRAVFTEEFEEIGKIIEIFGPEELPFISMKSSKKEFKPDNNLYAKMR